MKTILKPKTVLACGLLLVAIPQSPADDIKDFYEKQKAEIAPTFTPPELGSEVTVFMAAGQPRTGILMKLTDAEISLMTDAGAVSYKRFALKESSRAQFFAEDFAHVKALEKTQEYKERQHLEGVAQEYASMHEAGLTVVSKIDKSSDKNVEREETETKAGDTVTTTTTTKTRTEIQNLIVTIANNSTHPDTYTLEWYFLAVPIEGGDATVHDSGTASVTVEARSRHQRTITAAAFVEEEVSVNRDSSNSGHSGDPRVTKKGKENAGYVVLLKFGSDILDKKASSNTYLSDEWLGKLSR